MQQRSKFIQRTSALALAAVLALGMGVQAAGPSTSTVDDRREDLTIFYETLKEMCIRDSFSVSTDYLLGLSDQR